ncbi:hypothetical protein [Halobacillus massiliensis]|uniref:hypothetical protein n=1 Tax=Halobacillus massiliensis TaxID=1926286 RepID=UPI0009E5A060|nr:hypothetical protein [Halobacillus massiliensis]
MNNSGFTLIEVISAFGLLLLIILFTLPFLSQMRLEQKNLSIERMNVLDLESKLYEINQDTSFPIHTTGEWADFILKQSSGYIEGCARWKGEGKRAQKKEVCLYVPLP